MPDLRHKRFTFVKLRFTQVDLKMRYNDVRRSKPGQKDILTGKEWYEIQAFRALNQVKISLKLSTLCRNN